jgi:hypothetical protein
MLMDDNRLQEWLKQYGGAESTEQETETKDEEAT